MVIREFEPVDSDAVIALWHSCELVVPWNDPLKDIQRKLALGRDLFLVGEVEQTIVASVMGGYDGHRGWINYLAVSPQAQKMGYAKQLLAELESKLLAMGCPKINLQIRATNTDVIAFYEAAGYSDDHAHSMGKRLIPD